MRLVSLNWAWQVKRNKSGDKSHALQKYAAVNSPTPLRSAFPLFQNILESVVWRRQEAPILMEKTFYLLQGASLLVVKQLVGKKGRMQQPSSIHRWLWEGRHLLLELSIDQDLQGRPSMKYLSRSASFNEFGSPFCINWSNSLPSRWSCVGCWICPYRSR